MISEQTIHTIVEDYIKGTSVFLVQVKVKPANKIEVFVDEPNHIAIETCRNISKHIEANLNRGDEDFELMVSSPGIDEPFKVLAQYQKYIGKQVSVLKTDGIKLIGSLANVTNNNIELETKTTERKQAGKGRQTIVENLTITLNQIKETKLILPF
ncbi:MAG TPA: ribosome assembly cofactor RimP [Bacteroidia bacterium]